MTISEAARAARLHADNLSADIRNASTRIEGMRITRLAIEAEELAVNLERMTNDTEKEAPHPS